MTSLLDRINAAVDGLCPCGAPPAGGSAYCSDDCRPTHISADTDVRESGHLATPMRWRPDLVTDLDDSDLIPVDAPRTGYTGRFNASVFQRRSNPDLLHLRLDDGYRLVGVDVAEVADERGRISFEAAEMVRETWRRLERELVNPRHTEPVDDDPWADAGTSTAFRLDNANARFTPIPPLLPSLPALTGVPIVIDESIPAGQATFDRIGGTLILRARDHQFVLTDEIQERIREHYTECGRRAAQAVAGLAEAMRPALQQIGEAASAVARTLAAARLIEPTQPADPRERALAARRSRNTGPPPDRLDGRRRRR